MAAATSTGPRCFGTCKWFNSQKGYGFIGMPGEVDDVFVHQSDIHAKGFRSLCEGETVEFDLVTESRGRKKAIRVTGPNGDYVVGDSRQNNPVAQPTLSGGSVGASGGFMSSPYAQGAPGGSGFNFGGMYQGRGGGALSAAYGAGMMGGAPGYPGSQFYAMGGGGAGGMVDPRSFGGASGQFDGATGIYPGASPMYGGPTYYDPPPMHQR